METVLKLISLGADCDIVDNNGQTPIYYSIKSGRIEVCDFLLKQGIKQNITDKKNHSLISWAKKCNK